MTKSKMKTQTRPEQADDLFPADEGRVIASTDNQPPEPLPQGLAAVDDLPAMMKDDLEHLSADALAQLDVYARVPEQIEDAKMYERATTLGTRLKGVTDDIEKKRKKVKAPYLAATSAIDRAFKLTLPATKDADGADVAERTLAKELETAHAGIKSRLSAYDTRAYLAAEAKRKAEQEALAAAAAQDGIAMTALPVETAASEMVRSAHGGAAMRTVVTEWEVVDETKLPRSVLSVDRAKVQALLDCGATEIPGIAISKKVETHVRKR